MPIIKSAIKKLRSDRRKTAINSKIRQAYKKAVKVMREKPTIKKLAEAASLLDRAAKKKVIHKNKASRLKSRLARLLKK